jgi:hypothetical protein
MPHRMAKEAAVNEELKDHQGRGAEADAIADRARKAAGDGREGAAFTALKEAVETAGANERSAAAKELVDEQAAYQALHQALTDLGIEPEELPQSSLDS